MVKRPNEKTRYQHLNSGRKGRKNITSFASKRQAMLEPTSQQKGSHELMILTDQEMEKCLMGDLIQFGPNYRTFITIHSKSHGESIHGPLSRRSIGELVSSLLDTDEDIEIKIKKVFSSDR